MTKFFASVNFFLVVFTFAITADAIAPNAKKACGLPWNAFHHQNSTCKFWGKDGNGTHVHDGTCQWETGRHLFGILSCNTTSIES
ncbi:hypothetical protein DFJ43DRAFT_1045183 [Lentinula guzmanii]|uniref:Antifungal protein n=1 Tax=Lentinula guzmanii TaxID=2804957 RepID=A0AA38JLB1_9AGAR|nr:hypothetical protein DFJ43DRAFT_1045183 [Lentinula guzmanii]